MISVKEAQTTSGHSIGLLRLNAPQSLNALTLDMVVDAYEQLQHWADQRSDIVCVILSGEGRSFCAGGDVRRMRQGVLDGDDYCARFFAGEYLLDQMIHSYAKPIVVLGHGPVMGGGLGLFIGASQLALFKMAPDAGGVEIAAYLSGGPLAIICAMRIHPWLRATFGR